MNTQYTPDDLIVHRGSMQLIDEICDYDSNWIECITYHKEGFPFCNKEGKIPSWIGLEYMCQTIAAHEGTVRLSAGRDIRIGFVLGCRRYQTYTPHFHQGQHVRIRAQQEMKNDTDLGVYRCEIVDLNNNTLSTANIKAFMPENPDTVIEHKRKNR